MDSGSQIFDKGHEGSGHSRPEGDVTGVSSLKRLD